MRFRPPRCSIFLSPNPLEPQGFTVGRLDDVDHFVPVVEGVPGNGSLVDGVKGIVDVVGVIFLTATTGARTQYLIGCKLEELIQIFRSTRFPHKGPAALALPRTYHTKHPKTTSLEEAMCASHRAAMPTRSALETRRKHQT